MMVMGGGGGGKRGVVLLADSGLDAVVRCPFEECCTCSGEPCNNPDHVCMCVCMMGGGGRILW